MLASGDDAVVELKVDSVCHNGTCRHIFRNSRRSMVFLNEKQGLVFDNEYSWTITVKNDKIVRVRSVASSRTNTISRNLTTAARAYLDSALVKMALEQNE